MCRRSRVHWSKIRVEDSVIILPAPKEPARSELPPPAIQKQCEANQNSVYLDGRAGVAELARRK